MYDSRDNKPYTVRKLADGNCWMTDNLAFELQANQTYTGVDNATGQEVSFNTGASCSSNGACVMNGNTAYNSTTGQWYYSWYAATAGSGTSSQTNTDAPSSICPKGWRIPANYSLSPSKSYGSITNAYNLTTGGANNENTSISTLEASPLNFARYNYYDGGTLRSVDTGHGYYWSSNAWEDARFASYFHYGTGYTYPQYRIYKYGGISIRCVAV